LSTNDKAVLRRLAEEISEIAALPIQKEKAAMWRQLNDLEPVRPMVWINEIPWHELAGPELALHCADPWARQQESALQRTLYQWRHMRADMVVSDYLPSPLAIHNTGYGISEDVDIARMDATSDIVSRRFHRQIVEPSDIEKIKMPSVTHDEAATEAAYQRMLDVFGGVIPVRKEGVKHIWYTPWDELIRWWGVEEAIIDIIERPDMVHEAVDRCVASMNSGLDQMEALNLLSLGNDNTRVGSGGYGYTSALPCDLFDPDHVRTWNNWGCSNAQIFSTVSPEMHWDFAIRHDLPWLNRWGVNYYGCCEPLDTKVEILRRIPRLRKVSMSPWVDVERAAANAGTDFVISYKPNPAILAENEWRPDLARKTLRNALERLQGCHVEVIMKDISTVRYEPRRLWEWEQIAMELVEAYG
jgi:hypothetical protein